MAQEPPTKPTEPLARRLRRRGRGRSIVLGALMLAGCFGLARGLESAAAVAPAPPRAPEEAPAQAANWFPSLESLSGAARLPRFEQPLTVLFLASDVAGAPLNGRTDTLMLARIDPAAGTVRVLSIPRDTRVSVPGHGQAKINAANPYGGPALAVSTVSGFLGVPIDRYVLVNTRGVIQLVDALGGVQVQIDKPMRYVDRTQGLDINLQPGLRHLDGRQAHDFLRFRHDGQGDLGRVERQQAFLKALAAQCLTPDALWRVPALLQIARDNLATDMSPGELAAMASWGRERAGADGALRMAVLPGRDAWVRGGWYWVADQEAARRLVDGFLLGGEEPQHAALRP